MADSGKGALRSCDDSCGCTIPCPRDSSCRCTGSEQGVDHSTCSCGEHCGCNPCACPKTVVAGTACKCASSCSCASCHTS